jgi:LysR family nitrogen assimilation transcriptional regulator
VARPSKNSTSLVATRKEIDSRRLSYFYHVAKFGSISKAEASLGVAQPAISRQISLLEEEIGAPLLERTGRGAKLTAIGELLYQQAEIILDEMSSTLRLIDDAKRQPHSRVSVAASATAMSLYMPDAVLGFIADRPLTDLTVVQSSSGEVYEQLVSGKVDIGIIHHVPNTKKITSEKLTSEPMMLVVSREHELAGRKTISQEDLSLVSLILPSTVHGLRTTLDNYFGKISHSPSLSLQIDSVPLSRELITLGENYAAIFPESTCRMEFPSSAFVSIPMAPALSRSLYIAYWTNKAKDPDIVTLVKNIKRAVKNLPDSTKGQRRKKAAS